MPSIVPRALLILIGVGLVAAAVLVIVLACLEHAPASAAVVRLHICPPAC